MDQACHLPPGAATRHLKRGDDWIDDRGRISWTRSPDPGTWWL